MMSGYRFRMFASPECGPPTLWQKHTYLSTFYQNGRLYHCEVNQTWYFRHSSFSFCDLFYETASVWGYIASNGRMIGE
jgi:hypothetical protein